MLQGVTPLVLQSLILVLFAQPQFTGALPKTVLAVRVPLYV